MYSDVVRGRLQYFDKKIKMALKYMSIKTYIPVFNANSVDPDQTPRSAASDLGLHCLSTALLWDAGHKWVNPSIVPVIFNCSKPYKLTFHIIMMK